MNKCSKIFLFFIVMLMFFAIGCGKDDKDSKKEEYELNFEYSEIVLTGLNTEIPVIFSGIEFSDIEFTLNDNSCVKIENGKISPIFSGKAVLTAKYDETSVSLDIFVFPQFKSSYGLGEVVDLNSEFIYEVSDAEIFELNNNKLIAKKDGSAVLKIYTPSKNNYNEIVLKVSKGNPQFANSEIILTVGEEIFIETENYANEELEWKVSNEDVVMLFEDNFASAIDEGECIITAITKEGNEAQLLVIVINDKPRFNVQTENIVGSIIELNLTDGYNYDDVNIGVDSSYIEVLNNGSELKLLKEGSTTIKVSSKQYPQIFVEETIIIYSDMPMLNFNEKIEITVGEKIKINVINYTEGYTIKVDNTEIANYDNGLLEGIKPGTTEIKVSLDNDESKYTTMSVEVLPVMPQFSPVMQNIMIDDKTGFVITNIDLLEDKDISNYEYTVNDSSFGEIVDGIFTPKKEGTVTITCMHKNNNKVKSISTINIYKTVADIKDEIVITIKETDGILKAGEMFPTEILGDYTVDDYSMTTSNDLVLMVNSKGNILACKEGVAKVNIYLKKNPNIKTSITVKVEGIPNTNYIGRLIGIAEDEIGYREGANNDTKYGDWYGLPNEAWCAMFVSWCAKEAGISTDIIPKYAGCVAGMNWFVERDRFGYKESYTPKAGDIIFFLSNGAGHTGIVIACDGNKVYTIEGNTSNMVAKRNYSLDHNTITGYGIPDYPYYDGEVGEGDIGGSTGGEGESTT